MQNTRVQRYALIVATVVFVALAYPLFVAPHLDPDRALVIALLMLGAFFTAVPRLTAWADGVEWERE